jgi:YegS/Rv2252/BmrU family lipid kinase
VRVSVIINPIAGLFRRSDQGPRRAELARTVLAAAGVEADVRLTEYPGHARALAADVLARGTDLVYAWGGDGTVNEVGGLLAFAEAALAIVPAGSGNGLARALAIPRDPAAALRHALRVPERRIDVGEIAGHIFLNVAGVGFDAHIAAEFGREHGQRGFRRYARIVTRELFGYNARACRVTIETVVTEHRAFLLTVANGPQWGNGAIVAPGARLDDGLLDLVSVESPSRLQLLASVPRLFGGTLDRSRAVTMRQIVEARISGEAPLLFHFDGEPVLSEQADLLVRVRPGALRVRA